MTGTGSGSDEDASRSGRGSERSRRAVVQTASLVGVLLVVVVLLKVLADLAPSSPAPATASAPTSPSMSPSTSPSASGSVSAPLAPTPTVVTPSVVTTPTPTVVVRPRPEVPRLAEVDRRQKLLGRERLSAAERLDVDFVVGAYNVLGASHTQGKKGRKGYADADRRMPAQLRLLDAHGITVAGVQEFQRGQAQHFQALGGGRWEQYPGPGAGPAVENSVVWREDIWDFVEGRLTPVPYFGGVPRDMPTVLLQHRASGRSVWFGSFHNPADVHGRAGHLRARAVDIEVSLANELRQPDTDDEALAQKASTDRARSSRAEPVRTSTRTPVVFTGDMNDREAFICPFSRGTGMHSPDGAGQANGDCRTVERMSVDWIVGTQDIEFSDYRQDWSSKDRRLSDHPVIAARATLTGRGQERGCVDARSRAGTFRYCPVLTD